MISKQKQLLGAASILVSSLCFYLATVVIRNAKAEVVIDSYSYVLYRYMLGVLIFGFYFIVRGKVRSILPKEWKFLFLRAVTNALAVYAFFKAVDLTSVAEANILNMTYPVFTAIFSFFIFRKDRQWYLFFAAFLVFIGVALVVGVDNISLSPESFWGIFSGVMASFAIILLNLTRQKNSTEVVVFWVSLLIVIGVCVVNSSKIHLPAFLELKHLVASGIFGIAGQVFITFGYRHISAIEGGILSCARILYAIFLGSFLTNDPTLSTTALFGALLIFVVNVYVIVRRGSQAS